VLTNGQAGDNRVEEKGQNSHNNLQQNLSELRARIKAVTSARS
jgi:hypothetical protein